MVYDFECPKCKKITTVEMCLAELKKAEIFCSGEDKKHKKCKMNVVITYAHPKHSSWSNW